MSEKKMSRLEMMKREQESKRASSELVGQLTHQTEGKPDFSELAKKLEERKEREAKGENDDYVKLTIYIKKDIAASFNALITKRGQQKEFANIAFEDFILKKSRELGL